MQRIWNKISLKKNDFDYLILMDGDGEDQPEELVTLVNTAIENKR